MASYGNFGNMSAYFRAKSISPAGMPNGNNVNAWMTGGSTTYATSTLATRNRVAPYSNVTPAKALASSARLTTAPLIRTGFCIPVGGMFPLGDSPAVAPSFVAGTITPY